MPRVRWTLKEKRKERKVKTNVLDISIHYIATTLVERERERERKYNISTMPTPAIRLICSILPKSIHGMMISTEPTCVSSRRRMDPGVSSRLIIFLTSLRMHHPSHRFWISKTIGRLPTIMYSTTTTTITRAISKTRI